MKFKEILLEAEGDTLYDLLEKEYRKTRPTLIRGTSDKIDLYEERKIRKNREPRDTASMTHHFIDGVEDGYYPNVPKRTESKFATVYGDIKTADRFGKFIYVTFPHNTANIVSLDQDSIDYFYGFRPGTEKLIQYTKGKLPNLTKFLKVFSDEEKFSDLFYEQDNNKSAYYKLGKNSWGEIKKEVDRLKEIEIPLDKNVEGLRVNTKYKVLVKNIENWRDGIVNYFQDMEPGVKKGAEEVIFDGPKYLVVEQEFYDKHLKER